MSKHMLILNIDDLKSKMLEANKKIVFDNFEKEIKYQPLLIYSDDLWILNKKNNKLYKIKKR
ncbi:Uncharacterised protein [Mycoplasmopsis californica]|nr:Uncharacterised protein [Mycoplasmopsis californica]